MPALNEAISQRRFKQVVLLIKSGVDLNYKSSAGSTPLGQLCDVEPEHKALRLAKLFISKGAKIDKKDSRGRNALMCAILKEKKKLISLFLEEVLDFNLNAKDDDGNTALSHASAIGNVDAVREIVQELRRFGLSVDIANSDGLTPLMIASKRGNFACAQVILNEGKASVHVRDRKTWKNATEWQKSTAAPRQPTSNHLAEEKFSFGKIKKPKSSQPYTSLPRNTQAQRQVVRHLYNIYQHQLSSTYRIGFDNSKIENSYGNGCRISSPLQTQPESFERSQTNLEGSQARVLFTKSAAVIKFRKNSSVLNARKVSKRESSLSASCLAGSLSDTLKAARETTRETQLKQESFKQGADRPRLPIRSRSEILYTKTRKDGKEREIDFQYKKLPSIEKRRLSMSPIMLEEGVNKDITTLEKQMGKITEETQPLFLSGI